MPKYDASAFIAACDIHKISEESNVAKIFREVITLNSQDKDKLFAAVPSYVSIVSRAHEVKAEKPVKTSPVKTPENGNTVKVEKLEKLAKASPSKKSEKEGSPQVVELDNDSSSGTPERGDKVKREVNKFTDAEWEFAKKLYPEDWGVSEVPRSAFKFATTLKNKAHIKCAKSLKFLEATELQESLKEVFPDKDYSENDNIQVGYAIFAWIKSRKPQEGAKKAGQQGASD